MGWSLDPEFTAEEQSLLADAQERFGWPASPRPAWQFLAAARKRRSLFRLTPAKYHNFAARSAHEWLEIYNLLAQYRDDGFYRYPAQLEVLGQIIRQNSAHAVQRTLKILCLSPGAGYEACTLAMMLSGLGLEAKGWDMEVHCLEMTPVLHRQILEANYPRESLRPLPAEMVRRFFTPRAGGWHFREQAGKFIRPWQLNIHRLDEVPADIPKADIIAARGLTWDTPDSGIRPLVAKIRRQMKEECLVLTAPGEFWPDLDDFSLEERDGVIYFRRTFQKGGPGSPAKKPPRKNPRPPAAVRLGVRSQSLRWSAEEKLSLNPEEARLLAAELIDEESSERFFNPKSLALMLQAEEGLGRKQAAGVLREVLAGLGFDSGGKAWPADGSGPGEKKSPSAAGDGDGPGVKDSRAAGAAGGGTAGEKEAEAAGEKEAEAAGEKEAEAAGEKEAEAAGEKEAGTAGEKEAEAAVEKEAGTAGEKAAEAAEEKAAEAAGEKAAEAAGEKEAEAAGEKEAGAAGEKEAGTAGEEKG
ncbi:MAG: hypothetical protein LBK52_04850 [Deltaproteobacteria bacterium]|jgi:chemotaxis methyl-accepting protein methylase|nr:hypothetical protein [Deltaproteobacteria bacterium]